MNLTEAYARERQGYLDKAEGATDEAVREKFTARAAAVDAAAAALGLDLPSVGRRRVGAGR
jgi:hypothetical protein